jgi:NADH-quinone oxidoreductase subunit E
LSLARIAHPKKASLPVPAESEIASFLDELGVSPDSNLIGVLQQVQDRFGFLPAEALRRIGRRMRIPLSRIYGVVSFYAQFYTEPHGRHTVRCCRGTACHVKGAGRVLDAVQRELGVEEGETTPDLAFYLETVACLGTCFLAPAMMIDNLYFGRLTPQRVQSILRSYRANQP